MPSPQAPIHSGYDAASTAAQVIADISLAGKTAIVTGGYSGLGLETVRVLALAGADIIVPARSPERAQAAINGLGLPGIRVQALDLQDPASIDALADAFLAGGRPLHLLINSAGIMASPLRRDARGYESQFATNHLGHFQLTRRLWPALQRAQGARIVSVSSRGHHIAPVDFDDSISSAAPTTSGWPTARPRPPTRCSRSAPMRAANATASAPSPCIRAACWGRWRAI